MSPVGCEVICLQPVTQPVKSVRSMPCRAKSTSPFRRLTSLFSEIKKSHPAFEFWVFCVDRWIMGFNHMYQYPEYTRSQDCAAHSPYSDCPYPADAAPAGCFVPQDPEGILASQASVFTTFLGYFFGNILIHHQVPACKLSDLFPTSASFHECSFLLFKLC
jgi:hypothetical protein